MKVILKQDVRGLGRKGDLVEAAEGYARNYLLPRGLAEVASEGRLRVLAETRAAVERRERREDEEARALAARLRGAAVRVTVRAGEGGRLFGSVTSQDVATALREAFGVELDRRRIVLVAPIKTLGEHRVRVRLHPDHEVEVLVQVVAGDS